MVERLRDHYKITDENVLAVMNTVPRHHFVPEALRSQSYRDSALPIAGGQTISQPFIVARMTELLAPTKMERVLEIGSGSGYQTAILSMLAKKVFAVERLESLYKDALLKLRAIGIGNVSLRNADGTHGWEVYSPFDKILVAAGGPELPKPLLEQLEVGGKLIIPIGETQKTQRLIMATRTAKGFDTQDHGPSAFVPLIGSHGWEARN